MQSYSTGSHASTVVRLTSNLKITSDNPIVMPHDHPAAKSSIEYYYNVERHMGTNQTLSALRSSFG